MHNTISLILSRLYQYFIAIAVSGAMMDDALMCMMWSKIEMLLSIRDCVLLSMAGQKEADVKQFRCLVLMKFLLSIMQ